MTEQDNSNQEISESDRQDFIDIATEAVLEFASENSLVITREKAAVIAEQAVDECTNIKAA